MYKYVKRILDIILSLIFILLLLPILLLISIILLFTLKKQIIYTQIREGENKKPFKMYKFRTMIIDNNIPDKDRITKFGKILRNLSIDELPQLFNVLKGDMSLVGPRPFIVGEPLPSDYIDPIRYSVKPGMTGYAQIHGKRKLSHKDKIKYDVEYAKKYSLLLDIKIIFLTLFNMIQKNN
ncbi:MAG: sugar transferase [Firmicutes bacterium]|nr:sugar transferase [Bacillota bacterium]